MTEPGLFFEKSASGAEIGKHGPASKRRLPALPGLAIVWLVRISLFVLAVLLIYAIFWAVWYRRPPEPPKVVDLRGGETGQYHQIDFLASLAENPHGFPGHCYVVWSDKPIVSVNCMNGMETESGGFLPRYFGDQIPSLWMTVPGYLTKDAIRGNTRNLDRLTVLVSKSDFLATKRLTERWNASEFKVGERDCVTFVNHLARSISLRTPDPAYKFPQDYIRELKRLN